MNHEERIIGLINSVMPRSPLRKSVSGEVDSEVIMLGDKEYLFTTDDFSHEDRFCEEDPFDLGWNVACGAISDITAAGGKPLLYAHSMIIPPYWDEEYIKGFSEGVAAVLKIHAVSFVGGDLGISDVWRYTASVIGVPLGRQVNRRGCKPGDAIFLTGRIGAGNLMAMASLFEGAEHLLKGIGTRFRTQDDLGELISHFASAAIDTSDGVFNALNTLADLNRIGYRVSGLPFHPEGMQATRAMGLSELLLFLGECGEYEILFTVPVDQRDALKKELTTRGIVATEIGVMLADTHDRKVDHYDLADYKLRARDFPEVRDYIRTMIAWVAEHGSVHGVKQ